MLQIQIFDPHEDGETRITRDDGNFVCYGGSADCHEATTAALMKVKAELESRGESLASGDLCDITAQVINNIKLD